MDREISIGERRGRVARRGLWGLAMAVAAASLFVFATGWLRPSLKQSAIRLGVVTRGDLEATLNASGTVVPAAERVIASPVDGRVDRVIRRPGEVVEPGTEILELDIAETRLELERLDEKIAQNANERLQRRLEQEDNVANRESRIETQRLDLEMARFRDGQNEALYKEGLLSEDLYRETRVAVSKAEIAVRQLEEQAVTEVRLNEARLDGLALDAGILDKERDDARRQLRLATTAAPVAGVLSYVFEEVGAVVRRGDILARIADLESFRVEARISDAYAARLAVGQDAWVLVDDERLPARVDGILPTIEERTVRFTVALEDASHPGLRHNLSVDVLVVTGHRDNALIVLRGPFVQGGGNQHQVFVVDEDRNVARRTDVVLGMAGHTSYEVVDGLKEGDTVIISDVRDVIHAQEIRLK